VRREFSAGGVVVRKMAGRWWFAAIRPRRRPDDPDVWALPKGLIDPGERAAQTAVREVFEETGLQAVVHLRLGDVRYVYTWEGERVFKVVSFFLLRPTRGRIGLLPAGMDAEVAEARWLPLEERPSPLSYGGEREMTERAAETLSGDAL
jgi:8-oxo-dGTP pyrophosphatase MutT (NUDIX family)